MEWTETSERGRSSHWKGHFREKRICTKFGISFTRKGDTKQVLARDPPRDCYLILMLRVSRKSLTRRLGVGDGRDERFAGRGSTLTQHASMERKGSERQRRRRRRQRRPTNAPHARCVRARDAAAAGRTRLKSSARNTARSPDRHSGTALICCVRLIALPDVEQISILLHATLLELHGRPTLWVRGCR